MSGAKGARFDSALYPVCQRLKRILIFIEEDKKSEIQEIRLRTEKPLAVTINGKAVYICKNSSFTHFPEEAERVSKEDIEESYKNLVNNSVYSHINEIKQGFVMMSGANRAGIAGTFSEQGGITHISSINIRVAREIFGVSDRLFDSYNTGGVLICGPAGSGKTTLLRDFIRLLSNSGKRVAVVDSRGELSASTGGISYNDLGVNTDVLLGFEKEAGIECALRTLYPNIIAFDEIGTAKELKEVIRCLYSGADIVTTAHLGEISEIFKREITADLMKTGVIEKVVIMGKTANEPYKIYCAHEVKKECGL